MAIVARRAVLQIRFGRSDQLNLGLSALLKHDGGFGAVGRAEFRAGVRKVARDGVLTQAETFGDFAIHKSSPRELQDLDLPLAEAGPSSSLGNEAGAPTEVVIPAPDASEDFGGTRCSKGPQCFDSGQA